MSNVKILELDEVPEEGTGRQIDLEHPYTEWKYVLAFYNVEGKILLHLRQMQKLRRKS